MDEFSLSISSLASLWLAAAEAGGADAGGGAGSVAQRLLIPFILAVGAWFVLRAVVRRNQKLRRESVRVPGGGSPPLSSTHERERKTGADRDPELAKLYIELNEFAREMEGRMDTKIAYLKRLIADAEKVMERLERAMAEWRGQRAGSSGPPRHDGLVSTAPEVTVSPPRPTIDVLIGGSPAEISANGGGAARDAIAMRVLDLSRAGKSREEIASAAGIARGEVELILSLERAREKSSPQTSS